MEIIRLPFARQYGTGAAATGINRIHIMATVGSADAGGAPPLNGEGSRRIGLSRT